jgi:hypothetical protein
MYQATDKKVQTRTVKNDAERVAKHDDNLQEHSSD